MIPNAEEEVIVDLKCIAPRIDLHIRRIQTKEAGEYFHKRLQQLATAAKEKVLSLEQGDEVIANGQ